MSGEGSRLSSRLLADKADDTIDCESTSLLLYNTSFIITKLKVNIQIWNSYDDNLLKINWIVSFEDTFILVDYIWTYGAMLMRRNMTANTSKYTSKYVLHVTIINSICG